MEKFSNNYRTNWYAFFYEQNNMLLRLEWKLKWNKMKWDKREWSELSKKKSEIKQNRNKVSGFIYYYYYYLNDELE